MLIISRKSPVNERKVSFSIVLFSYLLYLEQRNTSDDEFIAIRPRGSAHGRSKGYLCEMKHLT